MADNELFGISEQLESSCGHEKEHVADPGNMVGDLISRQAVLDALYDWSEHSMTDAEAWHIRQVIGDIKSMPSAQQERKKGKWIYNSPVTMKCNQCGFVIKDWDWHRFKYCPNCIADMRGESDG